MIRKYFLLASVLVAIVVGIQDLISDTETRLLSAKPVFRAQNFYVEPPRERKQLQGKLFSEQSALQYLEARQSEIGWQRYHEPRVSIQHYPSGGLVRYEFFQDGFPVVGIYYEVSIDTDGKVTGEENHYRPLQRAEIGTGGIVRVSEIRNLLSARFDWPERELAAEPSILFVSPQSDLPELAYVIRAIDRRTRVPVHLVVRASDGQILARTVARGEFSATRSHPAELPSSENSDR